MKKYLIGFVAGVMCAGIVGGGYMYMHRVTPNGEMVNLLAPPKTYPLRKYTIPVLQKRAAQGANFRLGEITATEAAYRVQTFSYTTERKLVTGLAHIPNSCSENNRCSVIVQSRGYIYLEKFVTGAGTSPSAREYAKAGFVTLAPDFLGFGGSDQPSENVFEARFQTYTTVLDLLGLVPEVPFINPERIYLWGHSNGGQITLTVLEASGRPYPTVLWAPVTAPFPYSILYYSDEDDDKGKGLRKELARFEADYDVDEFAMVNYLDLIQAPIQLHVGGNDDLVPLTWGRKVVKSLKDMGKSVTYFEYPTADHNLKPNWNEVVEKDITFFRLANSSESW